MCILPAVLGSSDAQVSGPSLFEENYGEVKFLDAYFGTPGEKIEVKAGDSNVPLTVVFANVGNHDITGIEGYLSVPLGFTGTAGERGTIRAGSDANSFAGDTFHLTFLLNLDSSVEVREHQATVKLDYARVRESGVRSAFLSFDFLVTGDSVINVRTSEMFLHSIKDNSVTLVISNEGTSTLSSVVVSTAAPPGASASGMEVVMSESQWDLGNIEPESSAQLTTSIYVTESLQDVSLSIPLVISYVNSHGERQEVSRSVDYFVRGFIDVSVFNVSVIDLSGTPTIIGEVINEGNANGLFGFVTVEPRGASNIVPYEQFIDEIDTDAPIPFNAPVEFDGTPQYGQHDITIKVRYKDSIREETVVSHDATVLILEPDLEEEQEIPEIGGDGTVLVAAAAVAAIGIGTAMSVARRRRQNVPEDQ